MAHPAGSGLQAVTALSTPSCYVTTGGNGTSMTGAGHYKVLQGGDPAKHGLKVEDVARETDYFGSIFGARVSMDDFLNVKGPQLGDGGRVLRPGEQAQLSEVTGLAGPSTSVVANEAPPAPSSPSARPPCIGGLGLGLFGRDARSLKVAVSDEDAYSDDDEFEDEPLVAGVDRAVDTIELGPPDSARSRASSRPTSASSLLGGKHFRDLDNDTQTNLVHEAFAYVESFGGGKRGDRGPRGTKGTKGPKAGKGKKSKLAAKKGSRKAGGASKQGRGRSARGASRENPAEKVQGQDRRTAASQPPMESVTCVGARTMAQWKAAAPSPAPSVLTDVQNHQASKVGVEKGKLTAEAIAEMTKNLEQGLEVARLKDELQQEQLREQQQKDALARETSDFIANIRKELQL